MLTKSLHTVTAATNVARECIKVARRDGRVFCGAYALADAALTILGYPDCHAHTSTDPTVLKVVSACIGLLSAEQDGAK